MKKQKITYSLMFSGPNVFCKKITRHKSGVSLRKLICRWLPRKYNFNRLWQNKCHLLWSINDDGLIIIILTDIYFKRMIFSREKVILMPFLLRQTTVICYKAKGFNVWKQNYIPVCHAFNNEIETHYWFWVFFKYYTRLIRCYYHTVI